MKRLKSRSIRALRPGSPKPPSGGITDGIHGGSPIVLAGSISSTGCSRTVHYFRLLKRYPSLGIMLEAQPTQASLELTALALVKRHPGNRNRRIT